MTWVVAAVVATVIAVAAAVALGTGGSGEAGAVASSPTSDEVSPTTVERVGSGSDQPEDAGVTGAASRDASSSDQSSDPASVAVELTPSAVGPDAVEGDAPAVAPPDDDQSPTSDDDELDQLVEEHLDEDAAEQAAAEDELGDVEASPHDEAGLDAGETATP